MKFHESCVWRSGQYVGRKIAPVYVKVVIAGVCILVDCWHPLLCPWLRGGSHQITELRWLWGCRWVAAAIVAKSVNLGAECLNFYHEGGLLVLGRRGAGVPQVFEATESWHDIFDDNVVECRLINHGGVLKLFSPVAGDEVAADLGSLMGSCCWGSTLAGSRLGVSDGGAWEWSHVRKVTRILGTRLRGKGTCCRTSLRTVRSL